MRLIAAAVLGGLAALAGAGVTRLADADGTPTEAPVTAAPAPPKVVGWPAGATPQAPANFRVQAYARGLDGPRSMLVLPNGDLLVAEAHARTNRITLLRDSAGEGVADHQFVLLDGLNQPYGLALRRDRLYVANTDAVLSCQFLVGQTRVHRACRTLFELPAGGYDNHWTRNLAFTADESLMYVSVGSSTDVDEERRDEHEPHRAAILVAQPDGRELRVYASGLRNPVGLAFEPTRERLWTTVSERNLPGDERVPDFLTAVRDGAFYGWPYAYSGRNEDPRKRGQRPDLVRRAVVPDVPLGPQVAPLGLVFYRRDQFPKSYRGGAFIALHGSWNGSQFAGYKVAYVPFAAGRPAGPPQDFLTGFIRDADGDAVYGRPAGVAVAVDGALLVADDAGDTIWRVTFKCAACTPDTSPARPARSPPSRRPPPATRP
jgi:glucose/arabinose dehydrogenase